MCKHQSFHLINIFPLQPHKLKMAVANISDQAQYGGYDFSFTKPIPQKFHCNICTNVLRDPHLTVCCGQYFCEPCLEYWFKKQKTTCPHCRHENFNHFLNKAIKREINELEIRCTNQGLGCQWVGELSTLQTHLDSDKGCGDVEVQCSNECGEKMKRKELKEHLEQQCLLRKIQCQYCHYEDIYQTMTSKHYDECPHYPLPCPNKCGTTGIRRADMDNHRSRCELEPVECRYHKVGCMESLVRKEFQLHIDEYKDQHLLMLDTRFDLKKRELDECQRKLDESQTKLHNTSLKFLETREELEAHKLVEPIKLRRELTFWMKDYSLYKLTDKVWHSPPFCYQGGYKFCLAVYANGKGAGAGTHVSVELLQMKREHDDNQKWRRQLCPQYLHRRISIQIMAQSMTAQSPGKEVSLDRHFCYWCFSQQPQDEDVRVFKSEGLYPVSEDKFIDHRSAEQVTVLNDTIGLSITCSYYENI